MNTRTLSSSIRKRTSAKDERPSATGVGVVLGVGIVTFLVLAVIVPDIPMMIFSLRNNYVIQILIEKYRHRKWCTIDFDLTQCLWYVLYLLESIRNLKKIELYIIDLIFVQLFDSRVSLLFLDTCINYWISFNIYNSKSPLTAY